jgi:hypothetical protein
VTRKDYEAIAAAVASMEVDAQCRTRVASALADVLAKNNARFDRARFVAACSNEAT